MRKEWNLKLLGSLFIRHEENKHSKLVIYRITIRPTIITLYMTKQTINYAAKAKINKQFKKLN